MTDPIADFLTRIRNAVKANHKVVEAPGSKIKQEITKILYDQGYILAYKFGEDERGHATIKIALKYNPPDQGQCNQGTGAGEPSGPAPLCGCEGDAEGAQRSRYRHRLHSEGHHDRQACPRGERRRGSIVLYLLKRKGREIFSAGESAGVSGGCASAEAKISSGAFANQAK